MGPPGYFWGVGLMSLWSEDRSFESFADGVMACRRQPPTRAFPPIYGHARAESRGNLVKQQSMS
eukprot:7485346-Pyramimonas_sp.AAC.1